MATPNLYTGLNPNINWGSETAAFLKAFGLAADSLPEFEHRPEHIPSQVIYNGVTTIAVFPDGKKIKARPDKGAAFDPETGLAMCIARHVFGSRAAFLKAVEGANDQNKPVVPEAKKYWHELSFIQQRAVKSTEIPTYSRPEWCTWEHAMDWAGCQNLLNGYVRKDGLTGVCKLCKYSKTQKGAE